MKTAKSVNSGKTQIHLTYFSLPIICENLLVAALFAATDMSDIGLLPHSKNRSKVFHSNIEKLVFCVGSKITDSADKIVTECWSIGRHSDQGIIYLLNNGDMIVCSVKVIGQKQIQVRARKSF
jgi:hypothetical protein